MIVSTSSSSQWRLAAAYWGHGILTSPLILVKWIKFEAHIPPETGFAFGTQKWEKQYEIDMSSANLTLACPILTIFHRLVLGLIFGLRSFGFSLQWFALGPQGFFKAMRNIGVYTKVRHQREPILVLLFVMIILNITGIASTFLKLYFTDVKTTQVLNHTLILSGICKVHKVLTPSNPNRVYFPDCLSWWHSDKQTTEPWWLGLLKTS